MKRLNTISLLIVWAVSGILALPPEAHSGSITPNGGGVGGVNSGNGNATGNSGNGGTPNSSGGNGSSGSNTSGNNSTSNTSGQNTGSGSANSTSSSVPASTSSSLPSDTGGNSIPSSSSGVSMSVGAADGSAEGSRGEDVRLLVKKGKAVSMRKLLAFLDTNYQGRVINIQLNQTGKTYQYTVKLLTSDNRLKIIDLDAASLTPVTTASIY